MNKNRLTYIANIFFPCVLFSAVAGTLTAAAIFLFKLISSAIIELSGKIYSAVRLDLSLLPLLIIGAVVIGLMAGALQKKSPGCRGGGIPTAISALRGYVPLKKTRSIISVFLSSMLTYIAGIPLGTEGPSVQIGTLIGLGTSKVFGKKHPAWDRYIMTGGACAGFSVATGAPLSGLFFAFEEAHRRFSPMIFMMAAMTVAASSAVSELISRFFKIPTTLFSFEIKEILPIKYIWLSLIIGFICGVCALFFTKAYSSLRKIINVKLCHIPPLCKTVLIFLIVAVIGLCSTAFIGTGHDLINDIINRKGIWQLLIIVFCIRAFLLIISNSQGITGGLFVPTLAFGAVIGSVCGEIAQKLGLIEAEYYIIIVIIGMASFLSASSRTPITAIMFAIEALSGGSNILPIMIGATFSFVIIELMGIPSLADIVIEGKVDEYNKGLSPRIIDAYFTISKNAFVIGKEIHDVLWPASCAIISVNNIPSSSRIGAGMTEGDILHIHCRTFHPELTCAQLEALVGKQKFSIIGNAADTAESGDAVPDA